MKKLFMLLLMLLFAAGLLLTPVVSIAVPGNGNGNCNAGGNGNHYGWGKGNSTVTDPSSPVSVPEPGILFLLGSGMVGLAGWMAGARKKLRK